MEFSLLIAESEDGSYQPIEIVSGPSETDEAIANYIAHGAEFDWIAPARFVLWTRNHTGGYAVKQTIEA